MSTLSDYVSQNSKYINFGNQPEQIFKYLRAEIVDNTHPQADPGSKVVLYHVEQDGVEKTFKSQSFSLAEIMDGKEGKLLKVKRSGAGSSMKWTVEEMVDNVK